ncbi:MAG: hypothetical protein QM656_01090 [Paracoccaceae bacterium]
MSSNRFPLRVAEVALHRHFLPMRIPFRVAGARIDRIEQITARVRVIGPDGSVAAGLSADSPAPIWFDKGRPQAEVRADLAAALDYAAAIYLAAPPMTAFDLACEGNAAQETWRRDQSRRGGQAIPETIAAFGPALLDRAVLDALCKLSGHGLFDAVRRNLPGVDARLTPGLRGVDLDSWLRNLAPRNSIAVRHTIIGLDGPRPADDLPFTLAEVIRAYGNRYFKIKMGGDFDHNLALFAEIGAGLTQSRAADWAVTLDCNECFTDADEFAEMTARLARAPELGAFWDRVLYLEQPVHRRYWRSQPLKDMGKPVIIDETEGGFDDAAFAFGLGYRGVSAKSVKGFYKALLNAAQVTLTRPGCFLTAEDMNHPAGLVLQQDIAIALLLGLPHIEKNGHHFIGPVDRTAPFAPDAAAWPATYHNKGDRVGVRISGGRVSLGAGVHHAGFMSHAAGGHGL